MTWAWIVGGAVGGLFGVWLLVRQLKRGVIAEVESKAKDAYIESDLEARRHERETAELAEAARRRAGADPFDWF